MPLAHKLLGGLQQGLLPWFDGLQLDIETNAVPALSEDRERLWIQVGNADFLTTEEKRVAVGIV